MKILLILLLTITTIFAKNFDGKVKHISLLSEFNVIEIESNINSYETLYIRKNKNFKIEKENKVSGHCNDKRIKDGEYLDCMIIIKDKL